MSDLNELIDSQVRNHQTIAGLWYGVVTKPAPIAEDSDLFVIIPDIDKNTKWGPCFWSPRVTKIMANVAEPASSAHVGGVAEPAHNIEIARIILPVLKNKCLLLFDNRQNPWVVEWWPILP
jgi:hypothetical protein